MAAARQRIVDGAWDRKYFATLLAGQACRDERAAAYRSFYDQSAQREARDDAVAAWEIVLQRWSADWKFADQGTSRGDVARQLGVAARIHRVQTRTTHRNCHAIA